MVKVEAVNAVATKLIDLKDQGAPTEELLELEDDEFHPVLETLSKQLEEHKAVHMEELAAAKVSVSEVQTTSTITILMATFIAVVSNRFRHLNLIFHREADLKIAERRS